MGKFQEYLYIYIYTRVLYKNYISQDNLKRSYIKLST